MDKSKGGSEGTFSFWLSGELTCTRFAHFVLCDLKWRAAPSPSLLLRPSDLQLPAWITSLLTAGYWTSQLPQLRKSIPQKYNRSLTMPWKLYTMTTYRFGLQKLFALKYVQRFHLIGTFESILLNIFSHMSTYILPFCVSVEPRCSTARKVNLRMTRNCSFSHKQAHSDTHRHLSFRYIPSLYLSPHSQCFLFVTHKE